jgi:NitT/TauT family transport system ATP-binding protein
MNDSLLLNLENIVKQYKNPKGNLFTVLNDIDLHVGCSEFVSIVGPSGCGKSTLLRLILGAEDPTSGTILMENKPIGTPDRNRGIVFQKYSLFPHLTVLENLIFGLDAEAFNIPRRLFNPIGYGKKKTEFKSLAKEYLKRIGLSADSDKYPCQLSGGMRQRVAIAQSVVMKPKILLMDEPFGALDDSTRQDMQLFILEQWEQFKMTVFFVTHDLEEAIFLGQRILVLSQYYQTDSPLSQGAKIVADIKIDGPYPRPSTFKYSDYVSQLIEKIRRNGLDPNQRQHIKDFDLNHPNAFRSVNSEEWRR